MAKFYNSWDKESSTQILPNTVLVHDFCESEFCDLTFEYHPLHWVCPQPKQMWGSQNIFVKKGSFGLL